MLRHKKIVLVVMLLIQGVFSYAQEDRVIDAYNYLLSDKLDSAKAVINLVVADTESVNDGYAWYMRGFIYKTIYFKKERTNKKAPSRFEALNSFKRSLLIDTSKTNVERSRENLDLLSRTLNNDVKSSLDSLNYKSAIENFEIYQEYFKLLDTSKANYNAMLIKYLLALASDYTSIYEKDTKGKSEFLSLSKETYLKILVIDPNNYKAHFNMGILIYNEAVNLINQSDYDIDIVALNDIQDSSIKLFREAIPFMEKASQIDPKKKETLLGLSGIYFSLNEKEKSDYYKQKLKSIEN